MNPLSVIKRIPKNKLVKSIRAVKGKQLSSIMKVLKPSAAMEKYTQQTLKTIQKWPRDKLLRYMSDLSKASNKYKPGPAIAKKAYLLRQGKVNNAFKVKLPPKYTQALAAIRRKYGLKPPPNKRFA